MKKAILITLSLVVLVIVFLAAAPMLFKDQIKAAIDEELAKTVNADIYFEPENFSLTLFKNFPNVTASLEEFGVINRAPFAGEILFAAQELDVEVNLMSVLFNDQLRIKGITLYQPNINVLVLEDGSANYDVTFPDTAAVAETVETGEPMTFGIDHWEIIDGELIYDDASLPYRMELKGLNHTGSGDFSATVFDMDIYLAVDTVNVNFDGVDYLTNRRIETEMVMGMDLDQYKFTFKDNNTSLNDFGLAFDGWFMMDDEGYDMDLTFGSPANSFKSLLSLIPALYTDSFEDLEAAGTLDFGGQLNGRYSETSMPAFSINLGVNDGMFKYPDLPDAVKNVNVAVAIDNEDGVIENTKVDISSFNLELGNNPVKGRMLISNLKNYPIDADVQATLDLEEIGRLFPVEGTDMRGKFVLAAKANGTYDSIRNIIPELDITMSLENGYVKSAEFPIPVEDIHFSSSVENSSGRMDDTSIDIEDFSFRLDEDKFAGKFHVEDLSNYTWSGEVGGTIDLGKMMQVFPQEGMTLSGRIEANLKTAGEYKDVEAERYDRLYTSGKIVVTGLEYVEDELLPYGMKIEQATASFSPKTASIGNYIGTVGKSDFNITGYVENYIGYLFKDNESLKGNLTVNSRLIDLNEFMVALEEEDQAATEEEAPLEVIPVPENIDFTLKTSVKKILYDNMALNNAKGVVVVKNGVVDMKGLDFDMLGGHFKLTGLYHTKDEKRPYFDFGLDVDNVSIQQSYATFGTVQTFAPIAAAAAGDISTDFKLKGYLGEDMMPQYESLSGSGLLKVVEASLKDSKLVQNLAAKTNLKNAESATLKDIVMSAKVEKGRMGVDPFDVTLGKYKTNVAGSIGLDGSMSYGLNIEVPAGELGSQYNALVSQLSGEQKQTEKVNLLVGLTGTYDAPKIKIETAELTKQAKDAAKKAAEDVAKKEAEKLLSSVLKQQQDSAAADTVKKDAQQQAIEDVTEQATESLKNLFKKKKKN